MRKFVALVFFVFAFLLALSWTGNLPRDTYYKSVTSGNCSNEADNGPEMPKKFSGPALYERTLGLLRESHVALTDPKKRSEWTEKWQNKFTPEQLSDKKKTETAIKEMLASLNGRWDFFELPDDTPEKKDNPAPQKASEASPANAPKEPEVKPVVHYNEIGSGIVEITLDGLTHEAPKEMREALGKAQGKSVIILNLQDNPGGFVDETVQIGSYFKADGPFLTEFERVNDVLIKEPIIFDLEFIKHQESDGTIVRTRHKLLVAPGTKLYILISGKTASAAEILAGGLHKDATLVGSASLGKREGQVWMTLAYGAKMHMTTFKFALGGDENPKPLEPDVPSKNPLACAVIMAKLHQKCTS
jgi:hypothetical protein